MKCFLPNGVCRRWMLPLLLTVTLVPAGFASPYAWRSWLCPFVSSEHAEAERAVIHRGAKVLLPPVIDPAGPFCLNAPDETLTASPTGGTWSGPGIINGATGLFSPSAAGAGSHVITYNEPVSGSATITIIVWSVPTIVFISGDGTDCNGEATGNTILTVSGGTQFSGPVGCRYLYDWDWDGTPGNDDYNSPCAGGIDPEDLSNLPSGTYTVTVTDANGCSTTGTAVVDEPPAINLSADDVELECFGQTGDVIDLSVTGGIPGYTYDWDYDGTGDNNDPQDPVITGPGTYSVTVTDFLGCTATLSVVVSEPDELEADATAESVLCSGESTGEIDLTVTGGTPGYLYDWDYDGTGDNNDPQDPSGLPAGTYTVVVTDANGCTATTTVEIDEPTAEVTADVTGFDVTCFGAGDGSLDLTPGGGTGSYTFDWSNDGVGDNNDPEDLDNLDPGSYSVTVTDANGCTAVATVTIAEPGEITGTHTETICAGGSVVINGTTYDENNPSGTGVFAAANGCDSTVTVTISFDPPLEGEETYEGCEGDGYSVTVGGTVYNESNPNGTETISTADGCDSIVTISLTFSGPVYGDETYSGCEGDGYSVVVGGTVYDESNPTGTEVLTSAIGCDSIVTIALTFAGETFSTITNDGCQGDNFSITVNGTVYDESNPSGVEVIENAQGCDSTITINLNFGAPSESEVSHTSCTGSGYAVTVNGTIYNEGNPSGTEVLTNAAGCDSTITIELTFLPPTTGEETYLGCEGDGYEVVVNGTTYNEANPTGTETLTNAAGCDSIVTIALTFQGTVYGSETYTGCQGDGYVVVVGGIIFDEGNPNGTVTLQSGAGCDSVVTVSLTFNAPTSSTVSYEGCEGDGYTVVVNGTTYGESNPSGTETMTNAAGCDSVIAISLVFDAPTESQVTYQGCQGDGYQVVVNGTTYNEANPTGTETLTNVAGCDSTVTISLSFAAPDNTLITYDGCEGDGYTVVVNGTTYDENNPDGQEMLTGIGGCDSIVTIDLEFSSEIITILDPLLCDGGSIVVNGTVYDASNPTGTEHFVAQGGCDSIVMIDLSFLPPLTGEFFADICQGGSIIVNGTVYDENHTSGVEVYTSVGGCDSVVTVEIDILPPLTGDYYADICQGGFIIVNGTVYDENNTSGTEMFTTAEGCDSLVTVEIGILPPLTGLVYYEGCVGDGYFVVVNNVIYNQQNPAGTEMLTTPQGCDSIVTIDLHYNVVGSSEISYSGCAGDGYSVVVNGVTYDEANPSGEEYVETPAGCDSLVTIALSFAQPDTGYISHVGCIGDGFEVVVNGNTYDEVNPEGIEVVQTPQGCDSVVVISLDFTDGIEITLNPVVCAGGSVTIGGIVYDEGNPSDTLHLVATGGCDSTVYIQLQFLPVLEGAETYQGCAGDGYAVTVNGTVYDENNPVGTEFFQNGDGCDTLVSIQLEFNAEIHALVDPVLCAGDFVMVNGTIYDESNPFGTEIIPGQGTCDTVVTISLGFHPADTTLLSYTGCQGDGYTVVVNGTTYGESNPSGTEVLPGTDGCDSTVMVSLVFANCCVGQTSMQSASICNGYAYEWRGMSLDAEGTYTDVVPDAAGPGCDSTYILQLSVSDAVTMTFNHAICEGDDFPFGGAIYVSGGTYSDTIPNGSYQGCDSINMLVLTVHQLPLADAGADQEINCAMPEVVLSAQASSGATLTWQGPGITAANQHDLAPVVSRPGTYLLTVTGPGGCESSDEVVVTVDASTPIANAGPDLVITCDTPAVVLQPAPLGQHLQWHWEGPGILPSDQYSLNPVVEIAGAYVFHLVDTMSQCAAIPDTMFVEDIREDITASIEVSFMQNCGIVLDGSGSSLGGAIIYLWLDSLGNFLSDELILQLSGPGVYTLMIEDTLSGCEDAVSVLITNWVENPVISAGEDKVLDCRLSTTILSASVSSPATGFELEWTGPAGGILGSADQVSVEVGLPGMYQLTVTDQANGCQTIDTVWVTQQTELPPAVAVVDHHITCGQTTALVRAEGALPGDELEESWMDAQGAALGNAPQLEVHQAGVYILVVENTITGCINRDTAVVFATEAPVGEVVVTPEKCKGDLQGSILVADVQGGLPPFTYLLNGAGAQALPFFDGLAPGSYIVEVVDDAGCSWTREAVVGAGLDFSLSIGADITAQPGETVQLQSTVTLPWSAIDSIIWTPQEILSCATCPNPVATALYSTTIMATAWSDGCPADDRLELRVDTEHDAYIPNVFSPNFDGVNDYFTVFGKASLREIQLLEIFDRWGNNVFIKEDFEPNVPKSGWDGTFRGTPLNPGVYVFRAVVEFTDGYVGQFSGDVTLLR